MPKLKLTYFDMNAGRGEVARLAMTLGNIPFEDDRVAFAQFAARKASLPFGTIPILEVDGAILAQSNGINRYVGKLAKLYPEDALEAAFCDEAMDAVEDVGAKIVDSFSIKDEAEKRRVRQALAEGPITSYLKSLASRLEQRGGKWFADGRLTVADLKVFLWIRHLKSGKLEHVPADLPDLVAPLLVAHFERVRDHAGVKAYYDARS